MDANAIQKLLDGGIPLTHFIDVRVDAVRPGRVQLHLPFTPQAQNHLGTLYAGAVFSLAEIAGGVAVLTVFAPSQYLMVARRVEIDYRRPARSALSCVAQLSDELVAQTRAAVVEHGKADLTLDIEVQDAASTVVARVRGVYHVRHK